MCAIVRELENDLIRLNCKLKVSNFVPCGLESVIKQEVPDDHYILGVTYNNGQSQICMSGHIKEDESLEDGCSREMSEELFLEPKHSFRIIRSSRVNRFFAFDIRDTRISPRSVFEDKKDTEVRAVICVHGTDSSILRYMKNIKKQPYVNDSIVSIWAAKKKNILGVIFSVRRNSRIDNYIF